MLDDLTEDERSKLAAVRQRVMLFQCLVSAQAAESELAWARSAARHAGASEAYLAALASPGA